jgi:hypothetical protein
MSAPFIFSFLVSAPLIFSFLEKCTLLEVHDVGRAIKGGPDQTRDRPLDEWNFTAKQDCCTIPGIGKLP